MSFLKVFFKPVCRAFGKVFNVGTKAASNVSEAAAKAANKPKQSIFSRYLKLHQRYRNSAAYQEHRALNNYGLTSENYMYLE